MIKILATFGPSIWKADVLERLSKKINALRINTAHGDIKHQEEKIDFIREHTELPIVMDIKGPELRLEVEDIDKITEVKENETFVIYRDKDRFPHLTYDVFSSLRKGLTVLFEDGKLEGKIEKIDEEKIIVRALNSRKMRGRKNVAFPNVRLDGIPDITERDRELIKLAKKKGVEAIAISFVRRASAVKEVKKLGDFFVISKIEDIGGIENIEEITQASDGIMVARGDLALNTSFEKIPRYQKLLIDKAKKYGKLSIVATQVLDSMIEKPLPTRSELTDIANAVLEGADMIMLSGETAVGKHPEKCVEIIRKVDEDLKDLYKPMPVRAARGKIREMIAFELLLFNYIRGKKGMLKHIIIFSKSGKTVLKVAKFKFPSVFAFVQEGNIKILNMFFGVKARKMGKSVEEDLLALVKEGEIKEEENVALVVSLEKHGRETIDTLKIGNIKDIMGEDVNLQV